jgi:hypothetical protein
MRIVSLFLASAMFATAVAAPRILAQTQTANPPLGLVARGLKARVGNADLTDGSTVYTGDYISTEDGGDVLVRIGAASLELLEHSGAHIYAAPYGAVIELNHGSAVYNTPGGKTNIVVVASDVRATPDVTLADFGRVTIDDPCNVTVSNQRGQVNVQVGSENRIVEEGKAYRVRAENSIDYRKYLSPDADDYHHYHEHKPCAPIELVKGHAPMAAGKSRFLLVAMVGTGAITGVTVWKALESPDRP